MVLDAMFGFQCWVFNARCRLLGVAHCWWQMTRTPALLSKTLERSAWTWCFSMTTTPLSLHLEHSSFLWRLKLAIWCFEFSWKLSVFSTWSIWFVSFCLCLARWGCQRENPQKEVAADRPSNDNRANTARCCQHCRIVFCIISSSCALSMQCLKHCLIHSFLVLHCLQYYHLLLCIANVIILCILSSYCIVLWIVYSSYNLSMQCLIHCLINSFLLFVVL